MQEEEPKIQNGIIGITEENGCITVSLSGKIDANNFEEIQEKVLALIENDVRELVFNMDVVNYVSSAGLRMFSAINRKAAEKDISYKLTMMRRDIMKLFQMTGYASAFCIELKDEL